MIRAWRLVGSTYSDAAFDGEGASRYPGRWNYEGQPAVYLSDSRALAVLEVLAGLRKAKYLADYVLFRVEIPEDLIAVRRLQDLPDGWANLPPGTSSRQVGSAWIESRDSVALRVPSVIVPAESNIVLNTAHPGFGRVLVDPEGPFPLDSRFAT